MITHFQKQTNNVCHSFVRLRNLLVSDKTNKVLPNALPKIRWSATSRQTQCREKWRNISQIEILFVIKVEAKRQRKVCYLLRLYRKDQQTWKESNCKSISLLIKLSVTCIQLWGRGSPYILVSNKIPSCYTRPSCVRGQNYVLMKRTKIPTDNFWVISNVLGDEFEKKTKQEMLQFKHLRITQTSFTLLVLNQ